MTVLNFNEKKATQLACQFIYNNCGLIDPSRLMTLMYLADRKALVKWNRSITCDSYTAVENGVILDTIQYYLKDTRYLYSFWFNHINLSSENKLYTYRPCDPDNLSKAEIDVIESVTEKYLDYTEEELLQVLGYFLPEWKQIKIYPKPITIKDIFLAEDYSLKECTEISNEIEYVYYVNKY
jgi:hypothetical protein